MSAELKTIKESAGVSGADQLSKLCQARDRPGAAGSVSRPCRAAGTARGLPCVAGCGSIPCARSRCVCRVARVTRCGLSLPTPLQVSAEADTLRRRVVDLEAAAAGLAEARRTIEDLERRVFDGEMQRRKLHNTIQVGVRGPCRVVVGSGCAPMFVHTRKRVGHTCGAGNSEGEPVWRAELQRVQCLGGCVWECRSCAATSECAFACAPC